jgi:hypothetical protein
MAPPTPRESVDLGQTPAPAHQILNISITYGTVGAARSAPMLQQRRSAIAQK